MKYQNLFPITTIFLLLFLSGNCVAQKLNLNDLIKAYTLDSLSLKNFCNGKQFRLEKISEDHWIHSYTFRSIQNDTISFIRTFPKSKAPYVFLYYYFNSDDDYLTFRNEALKAGFKLNKRYDLMRGKSVASDVRERFNKGTLQLELSTNNFDKTRHVLLLSYFANNNY